MSSHSVRLLLAATLLLGTVACGSSDSGSPTTPSPTTPSPTTPTNRAPSISVAASTTFGIAQQTTVSFTASTSDPDGDLVTVSWNFGDGTGAAGNQVSRLYTAAGTMTVIATATDSKGASTASTPMAITVGSLSGQWSGSINVSAACLPGVTKPVTASLTQSGSVVTGTFSLPQGICNFTAGSAVTDPAEPGTFSSAGHMRVRVKIPPFIDVYFEGDMDRTGRHVSGGLQGSGHNGTPFVLDKQ